MQRTYTLNFPKGYIAHPYWPAREKLINIQKESGVNRVRSEEKRAKALRDYLKSRNMSHEDYTRLQDAAARQFYLASDLGPGQANGHAPTEIVIPAHQLYGMCAQACDLASSAIRIARKDNLRTVLKLTNLYTGKTQADGTWERFVVVTAGAGNKLSNQRALRENDFVGPFTSTLTAEFATDVLDPRRVDDFIVYCGREIGVGASRKLDWGRFTVSASQ